MKANIMVNGTGCIKSVVKKLSEISGLSNVQAHNDSMVSFIYHTEEAALMVFEELASNDLLKKEQVL